jgi:hypothetical protein
LFDFPNSPSVGQVYQPAGGPSWAWDGTVWKSYQANGETAIARTFIPGGSSAVTYTYNKPANLRHLEFEGVAAGASAGCAAAAAASTWGFASGGGGGSWGKKLFTAAALPASVVVTIGAPGAAVSSQGNGNDGAATTFGSLITLPGGIHGYLGTNVAYTSWNTVTAGGNTAMPTGVDTGAPGESADFPVVGLAVGSSPGTVLCYCGKAGGSPWGKGFPPQFAGAAGLVSMAGTGYGWGSTAGIASGGQGAKASVAGGPGAVLLTEYLAVAPADVAAPLKQTFTVPSTGLVVPVPPTARHVIIRGHLYATAALTPWLQVSHDGTNFFSGANDYTIGGTNHFSGSSASPQKQGYVTTTAITLAPGTDSTFVPMIIDCDFTVSKPSNGQCFGGQTRGWSYNSAGGAAYNASYQWMFHTGAGAINAATNQIAAFRIIPSASTFAAGSVLTVEWIY